MWRSGGFRGSILLLAAGAAACGGGEPDERGGMYEGPEDPDAFVATDSVRIMEELRVLSGDSMEGRQTGQPGNLRARDFILAAFQEAGLTEPPSGFVQPFEFRGRRDTTQVMQGANVVGYLPGTDPTLGAMVLTAHFDHLGVREGEVFNGADDNASGTVALMAIARYAARNPLRHTVVFAAVDGEEMGLRGARALVEAGWPDEVVVNVNMDMISRSDSLLFAVGTAHYPQLRPILEGVAGRSPVQLRFGHDVRGVEGEDDWTGSSDHAAFHREGIPFVYFGVEDHPDYHHATDDFELIDPAFYVNAVRTILAGVLALDENLPGTETQGEAGEAGSDPGQGVD